MAETMIERVARAICVASGLDPDRPFSSSNYSKETEPQEFAWHEYLPEARAAINAMREPTRAMHEAGLETTGMPGNTFRDMIDAALKE
ncbi:hypothetical protein FHW77_002877 [Agrobacterium sp. RC10-4-1]|uniref:hypothetical protein n=1 Tax=Agrobacterium sp. RC10-4-1 TaxID=2587039 RepID=UPI0015F7B4D8|nr:hypothetical protein [Agrobacterium sp. RC10-4-1]MBA8799158.1 hypothetical protein [Agrobacterium sp. RC10-4-1]